MKEQQSLRSYQLLLKKFFSETVQFNDMLLYHTVGTGKTVTSINMFSAINENLGGSYNLILMIKKSLFNNPWTMELKEWLDQDKIDCISFIFYDAPDADKQLIDALSRSRNQNRNNFFIIDESHNFIKSVISQSQSISQDDGTIAKKSQLIRMYTIIQQQKTHSTSSDKIVLLTATPIIQDAFETAVMFNLLSPGLFPTNRQEFNDLFVDRERLELNKSSELTFLQNIKNKISYVHIDSEDLYAKKITQEIKVPIDAYHESILIKHNIQGINNRRWQNFIFPQFQGFTMNYFFPTKEQKTKGDQQVQIKKMSIDEVRQGTINYFTSQPKDKLKDALCKHGAKYHKLCTEILSREGTHMIYSTAVSTAGLFAIKIYLQLFGFTEHNINDKNKSLKFIEFSGQVGQEERDKLLQDFNMSVNSDGSYIKVVLLSEVGSEGINLKNVRTIHIIEPLSNESEMTQVTGRGIRQGSHKDLPQDQRKVNVLVYFNIISSKKMRNIDQEIYIEQQRKTKVISSFIRALKSASIDCHLNIRPDADYQCFQPPIQFYKTNPDKMMNPIEKVMQLQKFIKKPLTVFMVKGIFIKAYQKAQQLQLGGMDQVDVIKFSDANVLDMWYQQQLGQFFEIKFGYLIGVAYKRNNIPFIILHRGNQVYVVEKVANASQQ